MDFKHRTPVVRRAYRAFVKRNDFLHKRKPDPGAALARAEKAVENVRQKLRGNALSVIPDTDNRLPAVRLTFDPNFALSVAQGIGDNIRKRTAKLNLIAVH